MMKFSELILLNAMSGHFVSLEAALISKSDYCDLFNFIRSKYKKMRNFARILHEPYIVVFVISVLRGLEKVSQLGYFFFFP